MRNVKNVNIEMSTGTTTQEEIKMRNVNIEEAKKIILEELNYVTESCYHMEENYNNHLSNYRTEEQRPENHKLHYLYSIREILSRSIERIYDARVERGVTEEELGREIDERRTELYQKFFKVDREIKKIITEIEAAEEISEEEREENIEEAKKIITEELSYVAESCFYMEEQYSNNLSNLRAEQHYDRIYHLRAIREIIDRSIERIYNTRVERGVSEEELGREIDERRVLLYQKSFNIDREIERLEAAAEEY